jgi:hypothetical protein
VLYARGALLLERKACVATDFRVLGGVSVDKAPQTLFPLRKTHNATPPVYRFIRRNNENQFLIYTEFSPIACLRVLYARGALLLERKACVATDFRVLGGGVSVHSSQQ